MLKYTKRRPHFRRFASLKLENEWRNKPIRYQFDEFSYHVIGWHMDKQKTGYWLDNTIPSDEPGEPGTWSRRWQGQFKFRMYGRVMQRIYEPWSMPRRRHRIAGVISHMAD